MFRFNFILSAAIGFVTALMLTTCASPSRVVWEYYDQCGRENPSFLVMAECGRQKRLAECVPNNACSPEGNMFMEYMDTLVLSVKKKELTEAEAMRCYTVAPVRRDAELNWLPDLIPTLPKARPSSCCLDVRQTTSSTFNVL